MPHAVHALHVIAPRGEPPARRNHGFAACCDRPFERLALRFAEPRLAFVTEDIGDGGSRLLLDQRVGIHETDAQPARQLASEGALAASHVTDQEEGFHHRQVKTGSVVRGRSLRRRRPWRVRSRTPPRPP